MEIQEETVTEAQEQKYSKFNTPDCAGNEEKLLNLIVEIIIKVIKKELE